MSYLESTFVFPSRGQSLPAILASPEEGGATGVLVLVGGPQYRVGSHRQFVLLSRALAAAGIPVLRFDSGGMGDASGRLLNFEQIDADIAAAVDAFFARQPGLQRVVLWGLCDAASASLFYAWRDPRVTGLVLLNPWVRTDAGLAQAYVSQYYGQRFLSADFWKKLLSGRVDVLGAIKGFIVKLYQSRSTATAPENKENLALPNRMFEGLRLFKGPVLTILSGNDLVAAEFSHLISISPDWQREMQSGRVSCRELPEANHTFSTKGWREQVERLTIEAVAGWKLGG